MSAEKSAEQMVEAARQVLKQCGYHVENLWHVDDVHLVCEQRGIPPFSFEEAMEVFAIASQQFDGEYGISWPQLEKAVFSFIQQKERLKDLCDEPRRMFACLPCGE